MSDARLRGVIIQCPVMDTKVYIEDPEHIGIDVQTNANYDSDLEIQVKCRCGRVHSMQRRFRG